MDGQGVKWSTTENAIEIVGALDQSQQAILNEDVQVFLTALHQRFAVPLASCMASRAARQREIDAGKLPQFLPETEHIRQGDWKIASIPLALQDRRVEITGPVVPKMIINALNANVKVFMADFEDSFAPTWLAILEGQQALKAANAGTLQFDDIKTGKHYQINPDPAVLICRTRGLHLEEKHVLWQGLPTSGALFDFAVYFYHNHQTLIDKGHGPYFYLPKLQSHQEAKWWSDVFHFTEDYFQLPEGTIKATVLIETLPAVFEMDEILYALKEHIVGLNCGRWDYIFSYIKTFKNHPDKVLPDRQSLGMNQPFLTAYSRLLVDTCHRRGAFAMGGMAAFIPDKDPEKNRAVLTKITDDKQWEANQGHDGTWIAHPGLAQTALTVFDKALGERTNQLTKISDEIVTASDLLNPAQGEKTEAGMRHNIRVAVQYLEAWIAGNGCVPIYGMMEDAATAEIARASIWQWIRHEQVLSNGETVTAALFERFLREELVAIEQEVGQIRYLSGRFDEAAELMRVLTLDEDLVEFLTLIGYDYLP